MALTYTQFEKIAAACGLGSVAAQDLKNFYDGTMVGLELSGDVSIGGTLDVAGATALAAATTVASTDATKSGLAVTNNGFGSGIAAVKGTTTLSAATSTGRGMRAEVAGTSNATAAAREAYGLYAEAAVTRSAGANDVTNIGCYATASGGQVNKALMADGTVDLNGNTTIDAASGTALAVTQAAIGTGISSTMTPVAGVGGTGCVSATANGTLDATAALRTANAGWFEASATRSAGANDVRNIAISSYAAGAQQNYAIKADIGGDVSLCSATDKLGFHGTAPIAKQTGVAVTAGGIHAALVALGLIAA